MKVLKYENEDKLSLYKYYNTQIDGTVILITAGCDISIPRHMPRKAYYKIIFIYKDKAMLLKKEFEKEKMSSNRAFLLGIKEAFERIKPNTKCKVIVPTALGFQKANEYKACNMNYIIDLKRLELSKKLNITIVELWHLADEVKALYNRIETYNSEYKLYKKIVNDELVYFAGLENNK